MLALGAMAQNPSSFPGSIVAIGGNAITVKTDAGATRQVTVGDDAQLLRVEPGQKSLAGAATITLSDLAVGDRVLVRVAADAASDPAPVQRIIAIKAADLAEKQERDREDWQRRGSGGLVKSVDPATGVIEIATGAGSAAKTVAVQVSSTTILRRYAAGSAAFDKATVAPIAAIHVGDQLRVRGDKNQDGTRIVAEEVVSGGFRNISGLVLSVDAANSTLTVKDLATKQPVVVHVGPDVPMHKIPEPMAAMLAMRLKAGSGAGASAAGSGGQAGRPAGMPYGAGTAAGPGNGPGNGPGTGTGYGTAAGAGGAYPGRGLGRAADMQQVLNRTPVIQIADLKKGDAIMLVSSQGAADVTAITVVAGVEPLLQAPAEAQNSLLSNWSLGGGAPEAPAQ